MNTCSVQEQVALDPNISTTLHTTRQISLNIVPPLLTVTVTYPFELISRYNIQLLPHLVNHLNKSEWYPLQVKLLTTINGVRGLQFVYFLDAEGIKVDSHINIGQMMNTQGMKKLRAATKVTMDVFVELLINHEIRDIIYPITDKLKDPHEHKEENNPFRQLPSAQQLQLSMYNSLAMFSPSVMLNTNKTIALWQDNSQKTSRRQTNLGNNGSGVSVPEVGEEYAYNWRQ